MIDNIALQCSLKGAIFGHSWQKFQDGIPKIEIIEQLTIKLSEDGAPLRYVNIWIDKWMPL